MSAVALAFDSASHTYRVGDLLVPSVTTILRGVRLIDFDGVSTGVLERAQQRGTWVHQAVQFDLEGQLDPSSVTEDLEPYLTAARAWRVTSGFQPLAVEARLYHPVYVYAGTADLIGTLDGVPTVADWKTGRAADVCADLQLAAYAACLRQTPPPEWFGMGGSDPVQRLSVELKADGTYRVHRYRSGRDFPLFLQALAIYHEQARRGLRMP